MRRIRRLLLCCIGLFLFLPSILVLLFQKDVKLLLYGTEKTERYLPGILYDVVNKQMHMETLKAQAVLVRSNVIYALEKGEITYEELKKEYELSSGIFEKENLEFYDCLVQACEETKGEVVFYNENVCYCPFFYSSSGTTRDAYSFFKDGRYPYLVAVPSHKDEESKSYITYHHFSIEEFSEIMNKLSGNSFQNRIEILESDESGYVTWINIGDAIVGGEMYRHALGLSSSCFSIEQEDRGIRITCKGRGHGFGFSQYGANAMAEEKNYKELIEYYFYNITIKNVYSFS